MKRTAAAVATLLLTASAVFGAAGSAAATTYATDSIKAALVAATNADRNCSTDLQLSTRLSDSASSHANDETNRDYNSHYTKSPFPHSYYDNTPWARMWWWGWKYTNGTRGENIAWGFYSVNSVEDAWMASASHRENIQDCSFDWMGVGYNSDQGKWVVDFSS